MVEITMPPIVGPMITPICQRRLISALAAGKSLWPTMRGNIASALGRCNPSTDANKPAITYITQTLGSELSELRSKMPDRTRAAASVAQTIFFRST